MKRNTHYYPLLICFFLGGFIQVSAQSDIWAQLEEIAIVDQKVMMPMRDGIRLATDIYRPKTNQPVPIIFSRTPTISIHGEMAKKATVPPNVPMKP